MNARSSIPFSQTPDLILYNPNLTADQKTLFAFIYSFLRQGKFCFYKNETLCLLMDCGLSKLKIDLKALELIGAIERIGHSFNRKFSLGVLFLNTWPQANKQKNKASNSTNIQHMDADVAGHGHNPTHISIATDLEKTTTGCSSEIPIKPNESEQGDAVISKEYDKKLLIARNDYIANDQRSDQEFLQDVKAHIDNRDKATYSLFMAVCGAIAIMRKYQRFDKPASRKHAIASYAKELETKQLLSERTRQASIKSPLGDGFIRQMKQKLCA